MGVSYPGDAFVGTDGRDIEVEEHSPGQFIMKKRTPSEPEDQKIKTANHKPPLAALPLQALIGPNRVAEYGGTKYQPGNYYCANLSDGAGPRYINAMLRHLAAMQQFNGLFTPVSLSALDPESGLPHIDHAVCGLMMLRSIMIKDGCLAADPWTDEFPTERLVREVRNRAGASDIAPPPRPTGPGDAP